MLSQLRIVGWWLVANRVGTGLGSAVAAADWVSMPPGAPKTAHLLRQPSEVCISFIETTLSHWRRVFDEAVNPRPASDDERAQQDPASSDTLDSHRKGHRRAQVISIY